MIPKVIHYCWFGRGEMPQKEKECVESWKEFFPDYELKLWNEDNFDYQSCEFSRQAYEEKIYAFVSDYTRAKVLYEYGGVYLDTDYMVLKNFRDILESSEGTIGFETRAHIGTAVIAALPKNEYIQRLVRYYETHSFVQKDGSFDKIANVSILTDILKEAGLKTGGERQKIDGFEIYNREFFYPKKLGESEFHITEQSVGIHLCSNSWLTERERNRGNNKFWIEIIRPLLIYFRKVGVKIVGKERIRKIEIKLRNFLK